MTQPIQSQYGIYQQAGFVGQLSRPNEPHAYHHGVLHVPSAATRIPRPGDPVYYNATENQFALPTSAALLNQVVGILGYDSGTVQQSGTASADQNSDQFIEFKDNARVKVLVMGTIYVVAGAALEYDDLLVFDTTNNDWIVRTQATAAGNTQAQINAALADLRQKPIVCVSREAVADGELAEAQIGYGRLH